MACRWTDDEYRMIRKLGAELSNRELSTMMPGRTYKAVKNKCELLGIRKNRQCISRIRREATEGVRNGKD